MKIEIKNLKFAEFASEETNCFEASVYVDGKREGAVSNEGRGGCNNWQPWTLKQRLDDYAKQTLPVEKTPWGEIEPDGDTIIDKLVTDQLMAKDLKRMLSRRFVMLDNGKLVSTKAYSAAQIKTWLAKGPEWVRAQLKNEQVLNLMSFDEAFNLYRTHG